MIRDTPILRVSEMTDGVSVEEFLIVLIAILIGIIWISFEIVGFIPFRYWSPYFSSDGKPHGVGDYLVLFCIGIVVGGITLSVLPGAIVASSTGRIATLFISPIVVGLVSKMIPAKEHYNCFLTGFWFTLGVASVRFVGAIH